ncbi:MAG: hypothetical protein LC099_02820, partial [Anaerolineales bacterium]|nr:hypothetical protein [Anaerolineales bacterium]
MQPKSRKKFFVYLLSLFLILTLITPNLSAQAAGFVIRPSSLDGWSWRTDSGSAGDGPRSFEVGPATPPLGTGSFHIELNSAAVGVSMGIQKYGGTPLDNISALSYSTYRTAPAGQTTITLQIAYDPDLTATVGGFGKPFYGYLIYEPYKNGLTVSDNVWQTWDAINGGNGRWWATPNGSSPVDDVCGQGSPCTWSYIISQFPNIGIHPGSTAFTFSGNRRIQLKAGSNWLGFRGNADGLHITINGVEDVYDFEPDLPTPTPTLTSTSTLTPTSTPTDVPTFTPTSTPTDVPTLTPTSTPTDVPTFTPTFTPTD